MLHVATVDSLLSPARTTLDIPPSCYVSICRATPAFSPSPLSTYLPPNKHFSPKIAPCPTLQRSFIFTLGATTSPPPPQASPAANSTSLICAPWPQHWAT